MRPSGSNLFPSPEFLLAVLSAEAQLVFQRPRKKRENTPISSLVAILLFICKSVWRRAAAERGGKEKRKKRERKKKENTNLT